MGGLDEYFDKYWTGRDLMTKYMPVRQFKGDDAFRKAKEYADTFVPGAHLFHQVMAVVMLNLPVSGSGWLFSISGNAIRAVGIYADMSSHKTVEYTVSYQPSTTRSVNLVANRLDINGHDYEYCFYYDNGTVIDMADVFESVEETQLMVASGLNKE